jgi:hypothetical protein
MSEAANDSPVHVIHAGTVALDATYRNQDLKDDPLRGDVGWVTPDGVVAKTGEQFTEPDLARADTLSAGGIANALNALAIICANEQRQQVGARVDHVRRKTRLSIMARMGDDEPKKRYLAMVHPDVDQSLISTVKGGNSGLSVVRLHGKTSDGIEEGTYAIRFRPGASGEWVPTDDEAERIRQFDPNLVNVSYPGLFPNGMDQDNGVTLSRFIGQLQQFCPMVGFDTHSPTELQHIEPSLSHVDTFNTNFANGARMFLGVREKDELKMLDRDEALQRMDQRIREYMSTPTGRPRLFTISHRDGTYVVFQSASGQIYSRNSLSPCARIPAAGGTVGAGDVQNGTTQLYLAREMGDMWRNGTVTFDDMCRASTIGQVSTTLHLQGEGGKAYEGVTMAQMDAVARSGRQFESIEDLRAALLAG